MHMITPDPSKKWIHMISSLHPLYRSVEVLCLAHNHCYLCSQLSTGAAGFCRVKQEDIIDTNSVQCLMFEAVILLLYMVLCLCWDVFFSFFYGVADDTDLCTS